MNTKLFFGSLLTVFTMLFWLILQPTESMAFIGSRIVIAFVSACFMFLSITWNEKQGKTRGLQVLLVVLGFGSIGNIAIGWGITKNCKVTVAVLFTLGLLSFLYIKYVEPKTRKKPLVS